MPILNLIIYSVTVVLIIYASCSVIDYIRLRFIEIPLFRRINNVSSNWKCDDPNAFKRVLTLYNGIGKNEMKGL